MKATTLFYNLLIICSLSLQIHVLPAQETGEATSPPTHLQTKYFEPELDPLGRQLENGDWQLTVSDSILIRSLRAALPGVGAVKQLKKQTIRNQPHLVFDARLAAAPDQAFYIAIPLRVDPNGQVFAERQYHTCTGDPCSWCVIRDNGCFCEDKAPADDPGWTGNCKHSTALKMALSKVAEGSRN